MSRGHTLTSSPRGSRAASPRRGEAQAGARTADPFATVELVHDYVSNTNKDLIDRRFLICLRDHLPLVGVERGCDLLSRFARRCVLRGTRQTGTVLFRCWLLAARRLVRGRRKLTAVVVSYAARRRKEIQWLVEQWIECEHSHRCERTFLDYTISHVKDDQKWRVMAELRAQYVHRWMQDMRLVWARHKGQSDNLFLWVLECGMPVASTTYFSLKTLLLDTFPRTRYEPPWAIGTTTIAELVHIHARMLWNEHRKRTSPTSKSKARSTGNEQEWLQFLVQNRTHRYSLEKFLKAPLLQLTIVPDAFVPFWTEDQPLFTDPPDGRESFFPASPTYSLPAVSFRGPSSPSLRSIATLEPLPVGKGGGTSPVPTLAHNDVMVSISKTTISMIGTSWMENPFFDGDVVAHEVVVREPARPFSAARIKQQQQQRSSPSRSDTTNPPRPDRRDPAKRSSIPCGSAKELVEKYERARNEIYRRPAKPTVPRLSKQHTPRKTADAALLAPTTATPRPLTAGSGGAGGTSTPFLTAHTAQLMPRYRNRRMDHYNPYPALKQLGAFELSSSEAAEGLGAS